MFTECGCEIKGNLEPQPKYQWIWMLGAMLWSWQKLYSAPMPMPRKQVALVDGGGLAGCVKDHL